MPYIKADDGRRDSLRYGAIAQSAGELNYQMFYTVKHTPEIAEYLIRRYVCNFLTDKPNYQKYNDLTGALIRCHREIKRRLNITADFLLTILDSYDDEIAIYEDVKIGENGDVE